MGRKKHAGRIVVVMLLLIIVVGVISYNWLMRGAIPFYDGEVTVKGLNDEVVVYFDERGMPHIYAGTEKDLFHATGWLMARERLWQMDLIRRATKGTLSEIFGEDFIDTDMFLRSLSMTEKSKMLLSDLNPEVVLTLQYYCDGVNRFIDDSNRRLPPEFRILGYRPSPWTLEDVANIIGYMGWDLASGSLSEDLFNYRFREKTGVESDSLLIPDWKQNRENVFTDYKLDNELLEEVSSLISELQKVESLGIVSLAGSNNWALSGERTTTGKPLLANDMHLGLSSPGIWMQIHQVVPGILNVTGVAVPGQPFVVSGHNERIAWGLTNLMVDDIDLYVETVSDERPGQYHFNGEWREMERRNEVIAVKGDDAEERDIWFTHRGPIISSMRNISDASVSMRWSGFDHSDEITAVYLLNRAKGWNDFRRAISNFRSISQNFAYADIEGNIGLHTGGGIPIRKGDGTIIRDGSTDEYDWKGYVPFEELPFSFNPASGEVSSANNRAVGDDYPYYISASYAMPYRIERIRSLTRAKERLSPSDYMEMLTDQVSVYASMLTPLIIASLEEQPKINGNEKKALELLKEWDYDMSLESEAAAVFEFFRIAFGEELLGDNLGDIYGSLPGAYRDYYILSVMTKATAGYTSDTLSLNGGSFTEIVISSFKRGVERLAEESDRRGLTNWRWGDIHTLTFEHPLGQVKLLDRLLKLNSREFPAGGSYHTVSPFSYGNDFRVNNGASQRHIYNLANWDESYSIIPTGNSGVPGSPFYLSQSENYMAGEIYSDHFSEEAVRENANHKLVLKPEKESR